MGFRKGLLIALSLLLLLGGMGTVYGEDSEQVILSFPDVADHHWAHPYTTKLALQGIILGDHLGQFNPDQHVRQQDAIIMAINFMGLGSAIFESDSSAVLPFQVDNYARPYVQLALDIGLLDAREELSTDGEEEEEEEEEEIWGRQSASREWVAKITIRAIQQEEEALALSSRNAPFTDNEAIADWALGYINRAVELDIVSGFDDGEFKPKGLVTRAQMAVFLSRSETYLRHVPDRVYVGLITELDGNRMIVEDENTGERYSFTVDNKAVVYNSSAGLSRASQSDLDLFYKVYVIAVNDQVYYIDILEDEIAMESIHGKIIAKDFDRDERKLTVLTEAGYLTLTLASNVTVVDTEGGGMNLGSLVEDSEIIMRRYAEADRPEIVQIVVESIPVNKSGEAKVMEVKEDSVTMEFEGEAQTYPLADNALLTYNNLILNGIEDLNPGDQIEFTVKNSVFTEIRVTQSAVPHLSYDEGIIDSIQQDRIYLFKSSQELKGYFIAEEVAIQLPGMEKPTISDLFNGDRVKLTINEGNVVIGIEVLNRQIEKRIQVEIVYYDKETSSLMLRLDRNTTALFKLNEDTVIRTDSARIDLENFGNLFTNGKLVDMIYSEDQLLQIKMSSYYDGTITKLNQDTGTLVMETEQFGEVSFDMEHAMVIAPETANYTLQDLEIGDKVRITLNSKQNEINLIQLNKTLIYEIDKKTDSSRRLLVNTAAGETSELYIGMQVPLYFQNGKRATIDDLPSEGPIMVSYMGSSIEAVYIPEMTSGKLTDVNLNNNTLRVLGYDGRNHTFTLNQEYLVVKDGRRYDNLQDANLTEEDRLRIAKDNEGNYYIYILRGENKKFWQYSSQTKTVSFRRSTQNEDYQFTINDQSFIHEDWVPVPLSSFRNGDEVTVYLQGNQIVEMTK